ncbi:universal stress protein [Flexivirga caeni]|uniref:Universal stress protein n=1 Tax=Flexivirga caeni TaxID=2294115 RepID=A0A3M9LXB4_9MICO|nr:universal stress protein [Flexivirga caeni]RNI17233.1 universal stress protein [Flexivirga caeni]
MSTTRQPAVIVGVDGSENSAKAVDWAAKQAQMTGNDLVLVAVWAPYARSLNTSPAGALAVAASGINPEREAASLLEDARTRFDPAGINVVAKTIEGYPGRSLVDEAQEGDLLVVGSEGRTGIAGMMLGSTSYYCLRHAQSTVVIIR